MPILNCFSLMLLVPLVLTSGMWMISRTLNLRCEEGIEGKIYVPANDDGSSRYLNSRLFEELFG